MLAEVTLIPYATIQRHRFSNGEATLWQAADNIRLTAASFANFFFNIHNAHRAITQSHGPTNHAAAASSSSNRSTVQVSLVNPAFIAGVAFNVE